MKVLSKKKFLARRGFFIEEIIKGRIFIYPTDTIYGIGCSAKIASSVNRIREIKTRNNKPFSIIVPSKNWILENLKVDIAKIKLLKKLPGPYTFILDLKNKNSISKNEVLGDKNSIGIRIPKNWFSNIISKSQIPFITTSVNICGKKHITQINQIPIEIINKVDYIIDCGIIDNPASTIIDISKDKFEIIRK